MVTVVVAGKLENEFASGLHVGPEGMIEQLSETVPAKPSCEERVTVVVAVASPSRACTLAGFALITNCGFRETVKPKGELRVTGPRSEFVVPTIVSGKDPAGVVGEAVIERRTAIGDPAKGETVAGV